MNIQSLTAHYQNHFVPGGGVFNANGIAVILPKPYVSKAHMHSDQFVRRISKENTLLIEQLNELISAFSLPEESKAAQLLKSINED